jgi:PAS domain S-box-containing protein
MIPRHGGAPGGDDSGRETMSALLRTIIDHLVDGIVVVDDEGRIRFANRAAEMLFGRPANELRNQPFGFAVVRGDTSEIDVVRRGGQTITAELRVSMIDWEGSPASLVSLRDVTDRRLAEERARALAESEVARREAEAASQAKSEFLAVMSHELRTPLNAILGYADLMQMGLGGPLTEQQRQQLDRVIASARHLLSLVNEVLDLARVEAGRLSVRHTEAGLGECIEAAVALVQPDADARGVALEGAQLVLDGTDRYVGDDDRVRQILVNLLTNAVKFTSRGGRVWVESGRADRVRDSTHVRRGEAVFVAVHDTGVGIPPNQLDAIFAPFVQGTTGHTRPKDGAGLGLTISRRLARLMGGDLLVRSETGRGSIFTLWLPAAATRTTTSTMTATGEHAIVAARQRVPGLARVAEALREQNGRICRDFLARLRREPPAASIEALTDAQLLDHVGTLLADIAASLLALDESAGGLSPLIADGTAIQRTVAERHAAQRIASGWTTGSLRREYAILAEETERAVRRGVGTADGPPLDEAIIVMGRLIEQAEHIAVKAAEKAVRATPTRPVARAELRVEG